MDGGRRYLDTGAAAAHVGLSPNTLNRMRVDGSGPRYAKLVRRVVYDVRRLDEWMEAQGRRSAVEPAGTGRKSRRRRRQLADASPGGSGPDAKSPDGSTLPVPGRAGSSAPRAGGGRDAAESGGHHLDTEAAAAYAGLSPSKLNRMRADGGGPPYVRKGHRVLYGIRRLDEWVAAHERRYTGERDEP